MPGSYTANGLRLLSDREAQKTAKFWLSSRSSRSSRSIGSVTR